MEVWEKRNPSPLPLPPALAGEYTSAKAPD